MSTTKTGPSERPTTTSRRPRGTGGLLVKRDSSGRETVVRGTTKETEVSPEILNEWVAWMVVAGFKAGCEFDG